MKYNSGSAFRRALEARLRNQSLISSVPLVRLRKMVTFDRFLARLTYKYPDNWVLKGGLALQLRMGERSRTTKDIDLLDLTHHEDIHDVLRTVGKLDMEDWFSFEVTKAEKVHAYTRFHPSGKGSRVKDFVDILLLAELGEIDGKLLWEALRATFENRKTHPLPNILPDTPASWITPYRKIAEDVKLGHITLEEANEAVKKFLTPVLSGEIEGKWDPGQWSWY
jgi:hypothetical protein